MRMNGTYVITTGPSAAGKNSLVEEILRLYPDSTRLVTYTTRPPRGGEKNGVDYHFVTAERFKAMAAAGEFLETDEHYGVGNWYGQPKADLEQLLATHRFVFGVIDPNGAVFTKRVMPECVTVFIRPSPPEVIRTRLATRTDVPAEQNALRVAAFDREMAMAPTYDRIIENRDGDEPAAVADLKAFLDTLT